MKILDRNMMKNLSFPDFNIEKIEFSSKEKKLEIYVEGAWLNTNGGFQLGQGVLYFSDWKNLSISEYNPETEKWTILDKTTFDFLKDICEVQFFDSTICLYGFGKKMGHWMEWKIQESKMHAAFTF